MKIVIGGQVDKQEVERLVRMHGGGRVTTEVMSDLDAAVALKNGEADYYLGACHTGGGGALAMAMAVLGAWRCETVSMPGKKPDAQRIVKAMESGKKAFGFTADHKEAAVGSIMDALVGKGDNRWR